MSSTTFLSFLFAASRSVGTAATLASAGIYLDRMGVVTKEGKRLLALISQQVTIPAFLFSKIVYCKQDKSMEECPSVIDILSGASMLIFWPLYVVGCGLLVGYIVARITNAPKWQRPVILAACAFGNSTGLPITLLAVIHANFPPTEELGRVDPALFLSIYLLLYPILQWGVGGWLLTPQDEKHVAEKWMGEGGLNKSIRYGSSQTLPFSPDSMVDSSPSEDEEEEEDMESQENDTEQVQLMIEETAKLANDSPSYGTTEELQRSPCSGGSRNSLVNGIHTVITKSLQPPVVGSLLGLFITAIKPLRGLFVDMIDRDDNAPLEWFFDGIYSVGQAAVPVNMIILGVNLSKSMTSTPADGELISNNTTVGIIIGKMVVMPLIGIATAMGMRQYLLNIDEAVDAAFYLVLMIVFITPTANNVMIMVELNDGAKEGVARLIALQYAVAPILLSLSVAVVVSLVVAYE